MIITITICHFRKLLKTITRQAVRDIIKKGENKLFELEEKLSVMDRMLKQDKKIQQILEELCKIQNSSSDKKIEKILNNVTKELSLMRI